MGWDGLAGDGETDIAARGFVRTRRVPYECFELGESPILSATIDIEHADQAPLPESPTGFPKGENFRGIADPGSADSTVAEATVEAQRAPPIKSSAKQSPRARMTRMPKARMPRVDSRFLRFFTGLKGADHRLTGGKVRQSAMEVNKKVMGTFAGAIWGAKGGDGRDGS